MFNNYIAQLFLFKFAITLSSQLSPQKIKYKRFTKKKIEKNDSRESRKSVVVFLIRYKEIVSYEACEFRKSTNSFL
jgi:hypothetical protein